MLADDIVGTDDTHVTLILPETIPKPDPSDPKSQRVYEVLSKAMAQERRSVMARMWAYRGTLYRALTKMHPVSTASYAPRYG